MFIQVPNNKRKNNSKAYNHRLYRKNSSLLKAIYDKECMVCKNESNEIEIHHNDRNKHNHDITNLVHCCRNCHKIIHLGNGIIKNVKENHIKRLEDYIKFLKINS